MLKNLGNLHGYSVMSRDGVKVGSVEDAYFDRERWTVRYLVVNTGGWFDRHPVSVSPPLVSAVDERERQLQVSSDSHTLRDAPRFELHVDASRRAEAAYLNYFRLPYYWGGAGVWGAGESPAPPPHISSSAWQAEVIADSQRYVHGIEELRGAHLAAADGEVGHVEGFLIDDHTWTIRYLVVDTSNWFGGRTVLVPVSNVTNVDWVNRQVHLNLHRQTIQQSPEYDPTTQLSEDYEARLRRTYQSVPAHHP